MCLVFFSRSKDFNTVYELFYLKEKRSWNYFTNQIVHGSIVFSLYQIWKLCAGIWLNWYKMHMHTLNKYNRYNTLNTYYVNDERKFKYIFIFHKRIIWKIVSITFNNIIKYDFASTGSLSFCQWCCRYPVFLTASPLLLRQFRKKKKNTLARKEKYFCYSCCWLILYFFMVCLFFSFCCCCYCCCCCT